MPSPDALLSVALSWVDLSIFAEVQRVRARGRALAQDSPWGAYIGDAEVDEILGDSLGIGPFRIPTDVTDGLRVLLDQRRGELRRAVALEDARASRGEDESPAGRLTRAFDLDEHDLTLLLLALAPEVNPRYLRLFAYLQDDAGTPWLTGGLALRFLADRRDERLILAARLSPGAPLLRHGLLTLAGSAGGEQPLLARPLVLAPRIARWLLHGERDDPALAGRVTRGASGVVAARPAVLDQVHALVAALPAGGAPPWIRIDARSPRDLFEAASALAGELGRPLLSVDLAAAEGIGVDPATQLRAVLREGRLHGALPLFHGTVEDGDGVLALVAHLAVDLPQPVLYSAAVAQAPALPGRRVLRLSLPELRLAEREEAWATALRDLGGVPQADPTLLARRYRFTPGQISLVCDAAKDLAVARGHALPGHAELHEAASQALLVDPGPLAQRVAVRRGWEDLVLPREASALLHELLAQAERRELVVESLGADRVRPGERGIKALFAGPPGTGKSLAAEVLARALGHSLFRVDLSAVVSKWVGETEKHLARLFAAAEDAPCVLLFDEADALFGKRTDVRGAQDRFANLEVSYLLQRLESFDGIAILTTNLKRNLDEAFLRRFTFVVDFPFPEAEQREAMWRLVLPPRYPLAEDIDLPSVAAEFALSGANIWTVAVAAACDAAQRPDGTISRTMLAHAVRREYEKLGRDTTALRPTMLLGGEAVLAEQRASGQPARALSAAEARKRKMEGR